MTPDIAQRPIEDRLEQIKDWAQCLADEAEHLGVIVTIERKSVEPLAMRNHIAVVEVRAKR